jgi:hypothetical protein
MEAVDKKTKKGATSKLDKVTQTHKTEDEKLSKIAQFMANRGSKGEIINMRAVLK